MNDVTQAIMREKQLERWLRTRKIELIESANPEWKDLCVEILHFATRSLS